MSSDQFRVEKDFLGVKEIPKHAYYGIQSLRAKENFPITHHKISFEFIQALAMVKKATVQANAKEGQLLEKLANVLLEATQEMIDGHLYDQIIVDPIQGGAGTSINMNINEVIANRALEIKGREKGDYNYINPNGHVNMSQSTNDVIPTAFQVSILVLLDKLIPTMQTMHQAFVEKSKEFDHIVKVGRTHLQDAVPIRMGQEFTAYARMIERDIKRLEAVKSELYEINLGATAVGTGLNAEVSYTTNAAAYLSEISGYPLVKAEDLVDATQNVDKYLEVSSVLKNCMVGMSKIANDLRLMSSGPRAGMSEIALPILQPGSSIMPGKVNPVMPELINQVAFQVIGNNETISIAAEAGQFELNVMKPVMIHNLLESITIMNNAFDVFTEKCIKGIRANEQVIAEYVEKSVGILTAVNPHIGYNVASEIAREAITTQTSVREICIKRGVLSEEELDKILDPYEVTNPGIAGKDLLYS